ncbi:MAG: PDZ domain-containing protein [Saprospiraceae bacterium]
MASIRNYSNAIGGSIFEYFMIRAFHCILVLILLLPLSAEAQMDNRVLGEVSQSVNLPFSIYNGFIVVEVLMDDILPVHFIFDTGAEQTLVLKPALIPILDLKIGRRVKLIGADLSREMFGLTVRKFDLQLAGTLRVNTDLIVLEEPYLNLDEIAGVPIEGILGANIWKNYVVKIDYNRQRITLYNPDNFSGVPEGYIQQKADFVRNKPYLEVDAQFQAGITVPLKLLLDTGAAVPIVLYTNQESKITLPPNTIKGRLGTGLGGFLEGFMGRVHELKFEGFQFQALIASFQDLDSLKLQMVDSSRNGILGNLLLKKFTIVIDYVQQKVYMQPNNKFNAPIEFDRSGLVLIAAGANLDRKMVLDIVDGSPADLAGIKPGDFITKFQAMPATLYSLGKMTTILCGKKGKTIRVRLSRDGKSKRKSFTLRDLI